MFLLQAFFLLTENMMGGENLEAYWTVFQRKNDTFDRPLANIVQKITLALNHFLANTTIRSHPVSRLSSRLK